MRFDDSPIKLRLRRFRVILQPVYVSRGDVEYVPLTQKSPLRRVEFKPTPILLRICQGELDRRTVLAIPDIEHLTAHSNPLAILDGTGGETELTGDEGGKDTGFAVIDHEGLSGNAGDSPLPAVSGGGEGETSANASFGARYNLFGSKSNEARKGRGAAT